MLEAIRTRRSIRRYDGRPVDPATIAALQEAVLRAPTSRDLRPWRFLFVTDPALLSALATAKSANAGFLAAAPLAVVVCGDEEASDCWIEDCSIAAAFLQLTATELGLGSCWAQIRGRSHADGRPAEDHVREILGLPGTPRVLCVIGVGHPAEEKPPRPAETLPWDKSETR
jgi:nitroreductase